MYLREHVNQSLPIKRDLTVAYLVSIVIALVMTIASIAGILFGSTIYPGLDAKMMPLFVGQDVLNLVVGLPMLLGAMWLARRGSLIGMLLWPGALFYVLYDYWYYVLGAPFNAFFLPYILLVTMSGYTIIGIVASIDGNAVRERLSSAIPSKLTGGVLVAIALLFTALWTMMTISALSSGTDLDQIAHVVVILDLTVQLPALLVGGILLWRRDPLGYVAATGLLLQAGAYLIGLSVITIIQEVGINAPFDPVAVLPGFVVGGVCLALIVPFARSAGKVEREELTNTGTSNPYPAKAG